MKLQVFTSKGVKSGEMDFPKTFSVNENLNLMAQANMVFESRSHKNTNKVKTRAEVNLSTKKIYKQKGTGGARHGDKKAPIFAGGGVAHGPRGLKRQLKISKNLKRLALKMFLTKKSAEKNVCFVDELNKINKTKSAVNLIRAVGKTLGNLKVNNVLLVLGEDKREVFKFFRNIRGVNLAYWGELNLREVYTSGIVLIDKDVVEKMSPKEKVKENKGAEIIKNNTKSVKVSTVKKKLSLKKSQKVVKKVSKS